MAVDPKHPTATGLPKSWYDTRSTETAPRARKSPPESRSGPPDPFGESDEPADFGTDSGTGGGEDRPSAYPGPRRNGGAKWFRPIDMADREDREGQGLARQRYSWRTLTGPAPITDTGNVFVARAYLIKVEAAIERGGWSSSEAVGLYKERDRWKARANGTDARYSIVGNRQGGLTKHETAAVRQQQIIADMIRDMSNWGRSDGD